MVLNACATRAPCSFDAIIHKYELSDPALARLALIVRGADTDAKDQQIADLQAKLQRKHEVLSELMEEHVQLKKALGEL